jgi:hypothetical protein
VRVEEKLAVSIEIEDRELFLFVRVFVILHCRGWGGQRERNVPQERQEEDQSQNVLSPIESHANE